MGLEDVNEDGVVEEAGGRAADALGLKRPLARCSFLVKERFRMLSSEEEGGLLREVCGASKQEEEPFGVGEGDGFWELAGDTFREGVGDALGDLRGEGNGNN